MSDTFNFATIARLSPRARLRPLGELARETWFPILPWTCVTAALAAGTVHAYYTLGPGVLAVLAAMQAGSQLLLRAVERAMRGDRELAALAHDRERSLAAVADAALRERRRVAIEVHDDALQLLLAAGQDLADGAPGRAGENLQAGIVGLRALLARHADELAREPHLAERLDALLERLRLRGIRTHLEVDPHIRAADARLLVPLAAELLSNVEKHAGATSVQVTATQDGLVVCDDGVGFDVERLPARRARGHVGLAAVAERVREHGGGLTVRSAPGAGTVIDVRLR
jgi:two-component system NarL family sensor kinase